MDNYILTYYQQIKDGTAGVGRWIRLLYEMVVSGLEDGRFFFDAKKAHRAIRYIETMCHHHEGPLAPGLIKLEVWQKALVSTIFGIVDESGLRYFREVFIIIGRKNGKTLLVSAISSYMLFLDGEYGARIYYCAPKLDQAKLCYDATYQMILQEPELSDLTKKRRTDIYVEQTNSSAAPIAFNAKKSDGLNPSLVCCDEIEAWLGEPGLKQYEALKSANGARPNPLMLSIGTAGYGSDGIYDELFKRSTRVLLGESQEKRLLPFIYQIDNPQKWSDLNELRKSNPNLGVSIKADYFIDEIAIAEGSLSKKAEFLTKYCNVKQNSSQAWLSTETIAKTVGDPLRLEDFRESYCIGGIDLSQTTDLTSACVVIERDERLNVFSHFWLPSEKIQEATERDGLPYKAYIKRGFLSPSGENFVDYKDVFNWFRQLVEVYKILPLHIGYDRFSAQYLINDLNAYGFLTDDVYQGWNLSPVLKEIGGLMKDGKICIGDNDLLRVHFLDSALKMDTESDKVKLVKISKNAHIDGMAAFSDAMTVRQKWSQEYGERLKNKHHGNIRKNLRQQKADADQD